MSLANSLAFGFLVIINEPECDLGRNRDFIRNFIWAAPPPTIVPRESPRQNPEYVQSVSASRRCVFEAQT